VTTSKGKEMNAGMFKITKSYYERQEGLHDLIKSLIHNSPWLPIFYCINADGDGLMETNPYFAGARHILRIECWVATANQYVYVERLTGNHAWSIPKMGEHPGSEFEVRTLEDVWQYIPDGTCTNEIHPAVLDVVLSKPVNLAVILNGDPHSSDKIDFDKTVIEARQGFKHGFVETKEEPVLTDIYVVYDVEEDTNGDAKIILGAESQVDAKEKAASLWGYDHSDEESLVEFMKEARALQLTHGQAFLLGLVK